MSDKNKLGPISRIIETEAYLSGNASSQWITGTLGVAFFIILGFLDSQMKTIVDIGVIFSQLQVFISIFLTIRIKKWGYVISVILNLLLVFTHTIMPLAQPGSQMKPMIVIPLSTIFIISIIYLFIVNYHRKIDEITVQNQKMAEQNDLLTAYNQIIKSNEEKLSHMAFIDMLTDLPNRKMLISRIDQLISSIEEPDLPFAIAFIDLDDFKQVNDTLGHHVGDLLLQAVAAKLKDAIHDDDMLGRLGGDEFALVIKRPLTDAALYAYIENLRQLLIDDLVIEDKPLAIRASFGLSRYPEDGITSAELLKSADHAMYRAKTRKTAGIEFYSQETKADTPTKLNYEHYFNLALENNEFDLVFQPQFAAVSKQLRGFEVLIRWTSAALGAVSPEIFLPIAEKNGLMPLLGQWIFHEACEKYQEFKNIYPAPLIMSINISAVELLDPGFVPMVKATLAQAGMVASNLELEIRESTFLAASAQLTEVIHELRSAGILIALDDFGKIMTYINDLPALSIDAIKLAQSYIDAIDGGNGINHPLAAMVLLGHQLNLSVFAKSVENPTQVDYLQRHQCDYIQGHWWSPPLDAPGFLQLLETLPV